MSATDGQRPCSGCLKKYGLARVAAKQYDAGKAITKLKRAGVNPQWRTMYDSEYKAIKRRSPFDEKLPKLKLSAKMQLIREYQLVLWAEISTYFPKIDWGPAIDGWNHLVTQMDESDDMYENLLHLLYVNKGEPSKEDV